MSSPPREKPPTPGDQEALKRRAVLAAVLKPKRRSATHPRLSDRSRTFLATLTFPELLLSYVLLVALTAALGGIALWLSAPDGTFSNVVDGISASFFALVSLPPDEVNTSNASGTFKVIIGLIGLASILLPAIFLGAIVFRLFVREEIFAFRKRPSLVRRSFDGEPMRWYLAIRLYPTSQLMVIDVGFKVFYQYSPDGTRLLSNKSLKIRGREWPIANTHVPFTIYVLLDDDDVNADRELVGIQCAKVVPDSTLIVHVRGTAPQLGSDLSEFHRVPVPEDLEPGDFHGVEVLYDGKAGSWEGWENFEEEKRSA